MPTQTFFNLPQEKRQAILDAALDEFAGNDYRNASISRIVARTGIAKGSFYQYFDDKKDLYLYLIELAMLEKKRFLSCHPPPQQQTNLFDYLRWLIKTGLAFEFSSPRLSQVGYRALYGNAEGLEKVMSMAQTVAHQFYQELIANAAARGEIRPGLDPHLVEFVFSVISMEFGKYLLQRLNISHETLVSETFSFNQQEIEELFDQMIGILQFGMSAAPNPEDSL